jgi:predicted O-linked N-acetylglucosamine transferase (SPINDLY family)
MLLGGVEERSVEKSLIHSFQELGIEPERLILRPRVSFDKYLELHNEVDLLLDTIPYSGGTTTNHGLWMGVPTLTLAGETLPGRQGVSLMNYIGLPQFVADNEDEFVAKAKTWTMNIPELTVIRAGMRARIKHSALRSPEQLTRGLEKAFREMWWRWCRGEAPANFEVD